MKKIKTYKWHTLYEQGDDALLVNNEWGVTQLIFKNYKSMSPIDIDDHVRDVDDQYLLTGQIIISLKEFEK